MREDYDKRKSGRPRRKTGVSLKIPILITVLVLIILTTVALILPAFNVVEVYCEGNSEVKTEDIITAARLETGKNIFLENLGRARRSVEGITKVKSADIRRVFPNKICISVTERVSYAYVPSNGGMALISEDEVVLKVPDGGEVSRISQAKTPNFDTAVQDNSNNSNNNNSDNNNQSKSEQSGGENDKNGNSGDSSDSESGSDGNGEKTDSQNGNNSDSNTENKENNTDNSDAAQNSGADITDVPLVSGLEINNPQEGKKVECNDEEKLKKLYELCRALSSAELLTRSTYINIENTDDITVVIENRLEVQLGKADNINYRCRFLAEVINTKLSATESVILDYRGDDIYAVNRDDGGERVKKTAKPSKSTDENNGSDSQKSKTDNGDSSDSADTSGSGDSADTSGSGGSNKSSKSSDSADSSNSNSSGSSGSSTKSNTKTAQDDDEYL